DQGVITTKDAAFGTIQEKIIQPVSFVVADPSSGEKEVVAAAEFELYPVKVTEVQAQKSMFLNLSTKKTGRLTPKSLPEKACQTYYTYQTSNAKVAKVYTDGTVEAVGNGTANITITAGDGSKKKTTCKVTVSQPVTELTISTKDGRETCGTGMTLQMYAHADAAASSDKVNWTVVQNDKVATIDQNGLLRVGKNIGFDRFIWVTATAADGSGVEATKMIDVCESISRLSIDQSKLTLATSNTEKYPISTEVKFSGTKERPLKVIVSNPDVAESWQTAPDKYIVIAKRKGNTSITYKAIDGSGKSVKCNVKVVEPVTDLSISTQTGSNYLSPGKSVKMIATVNEGANEKGVYWKFKNPEQDELYATLSKDGKLTAKTVSENQVVSVYALAKDGSATASEPYDININQYPLKRIGIHYGREADETVQTTLCTGDRIGTFLNEKEFNIQAWGIDSEQREVMLSDVPFTVTSSNSNVVNVKEVREDKIFVIQSGNQAGTAKITVTAKDGSNMKKTLTVKVVNPVRNITIMSQTDSYDIASGTKLQMKAFATANASDKKVKWLLTSPDPDIDLEKYVTLSSSGVLEVSKDNQRKFEINVSATAMDGSEVRANKNLMVYPRGEKINLYREGKTEPGEELPKSFTVESEEYFVIKSDREDACPSYKITYTQGAVRVFSLVEEDDTMLHFFPAKKGKTTIKITALDGTNMTATYTVYTNNPK
ncbi:MAG: hypothetical protein GX567_08260, partial [Clostridia bacterium]|nr:hypothetical protein [Clostridia bacterium]